jgi:preprotein translocase subunit SecB
MKMQMSHWNVDKLSFSTLKENQRREKNSFDLNTSQFFSEDISNSFSIHFEIEIRDTNFDLQIETLFIFELDNEIDEKFKLSDFPKINAPAIAFPYLRAYISNFTLQSGFSPIILPSINFVELAKQKSEETQFQMDSKLLGDSKKG